MTSLRATGRATLWTGAVLLAFVGGLWLGLRAGAFNARIDFCDDDTSGRYIADHAARAASYDGAP